MNRPTLESVMARQAGQTDEGPTIELDGTTVPIESLNVNQVEDLFTRLHEYPSMTLDQKVQLAQHLERMQAGAPESEGTPPMPSNALGPIEGQETPVSRVPVDQMSREDADFLLNEKNLTMRQRDLLGQRKASLGNARQEAGAIARAEQETTATAQRRQEAEAVARAEQETAMTAQRRQEASNIAATAQRRQEAEAVVRAEQEAATTAQRRQEASNIADAEQRQTVH